MIRSMQLLTLPRWGRRSTLATTSSLRTEVCPPALRHEPRTAGSRRCSGCWRRRRGRLSRTRPPAPVRDEFIALLADIDGDDALRLRRRVTQTRSLRELWHLRADTYRVIGNRAQPERGRNAARAAEPPLPDTGTALAVRSAVMHAAAPRHFTPGAGAPATPVLGWPRGVPSSSSKLTSCRRWPTCPMRPGCTPRCAARRNRSTSGCCARRSSLHWPVPTRLRQRRRLLRRGLDSIFPDLDPGSAFVPF